MWRCIALAAIAGCGRIAFETRGGDAGDSSSTDAVARCTTWSTFSAPTKLPGPVNDPIDDDWSGTPTLGGLEIYFQSARAGSQGSDIWFATRASTTQSFSAANLVIGVDSAGSESGPTLTADGLAILFERDATLWTASRTSTMAAWEGVHVLVNASIGQASGPFVTADGLRLVFNSGVTGFGDIYEATRTDITADFDAPIRRTELDAGGREYSPTLSPDGLDIWFSSPRGEVGMDDIYTAHRTAVGQSFATPVLVPELSSARADTGVRMAVDATTMYLNYDTITTGGANADLYVATRSCLN